MDEVQVVKIKVAYDLYILLAPTASEESFNATRDAMGKILEENNANIQKLSPLVKTTLSYPIQRHTHAYAMSIQFLADPGAISAIRKSIDSLELKPLRYLLSKEEKKKIIKARRVRPAHLTEKTTPAEASGTPSSAKDEGGTAATRDSVPAEGQEKQGVALEKNQITVPNNKVTLDDIEKKLDEIMGNL